MAILKRFEIWLLLGLMAAALIFALRAETPVEAELGDSNESPPIRVAEVFPDTVSAPVPDADKAEKLDDEKNDAGKKEAEPLFKVQNVKVTATQQGRVVDLTLLGQAKGPDPVDFNLNMDAISVTTESGDEVDRFFLPFPDSAVMDADEKSIVSLKYWLRDDDTKVLWVKLFDHKLKAEIPK